MFKGVKKVFIPLKQKICNNKYLADNKTFQLFEADIAPDKWSKFKIIEINKGLNMNIVGDTCDKEVKEIVMHDIFSKVGIINTDTINRFTKIW